MSLKIQVSSKGYAEFMVGWCDSWSEGKLSRCRNYSCGMGGCQGWCIRKKAFVMFPSLMESHWKAYDYFKQSYVMTRIPEGFVELSFHDFYTAEGKTIAQQLCFFIKDYQIIISNWLWNFEANLAEVKALAHFQQVLVTKLEALGASIIAPEEDGEEIFNTCSQQVLSQIRNKCVYVTLL